MLLPSKIYHIYNRANGKENIFLSEENYHFFLSKIVQYLLPTVEVYCYCLLPNHFHFLVRIKTKEETILFYEQRLQHSLLSTEEKNLIQIELQKLEKCDTTEKFSLFVSKEFSKLFSSYTQAFNKKYERKGSLFMKNFKRKEIDTTSYLTAIIRYIHRNPIHHGIVSKFEDWKWSSYSSFLSSKFSNINKDVVLKWFGNEDEFIKIHKSLMKDKIEEEFE